MAVSAASICNWLAKASPTKSWLVASCCRHSAFNGWSATTDSNIRRARFAVSNAFPPYR